LVACKSVQVVVMFIMMYRIRAKSWPPWFSWFSI